MSTYKALGDLVVAGKGVKAGASFDTTAEQAAPAVSFGLAEVVEAGPSEGNVSGSHVPNPKPKPKPKAKRGKAS